MPSKQVSLLDFAQQAKAEKPSRCPVCNLPQEILNEIDEARSMNPPVIYRDILDWLHNHKEHPEVKQRALENHQLNHKKAE